MALDELVNMSIVWAHTIERALHDPGPWVFRTHEGNTPAHRIFDHNKGEIVFTGVARPSLDGMVELWAGGHMVTMAPVDFNKGERIVWRLSLREPQIAS